MSAAHELTESDKRKLRMSDAAERLRDALQAASLDEELAGRPPVQIPRALEPEQVRTIHIAPHVRKNGEMVPGYERVVRSEKAGRPERGLTFREAVAALDAARASGQPSVLESVMAAMIEVAKEGDVQAGRLIASRLDPEPVGRPIKLDINRTMSTEEKLATVEEAVGKGIITPSEGVQFSQILLRTVELSELKEIRAEIQALREDRKREN